MIIEQLITRRKNTLKRACRFLNGIIGIWISGSIHDLLHFHDLLMNSTNSDDDLETFLSSFEPLQLETIMDSVKTNLVRWITSEKIGKTILSKLYNVNLTSIWHLGLKNELKIKFIVFHQNLVRPHGKVECKF